MSVAQGGAVGAGTTSTASTRVTPGGALAGGNPPHDDFEVTDNVPAGGAVAQGTGPTIRISLAAGGATGNGATPTDYVAATPSVGAAVLAGVSPRTKATISSRGAAIAGGFDQVARRVYRAGTTGQIAEAGSGLSHREQAGAIPRSSAAVGSGTDPRIAQPTAGTT